MDVHIKPSTLGGCVKAPPSKSYAHRLVLCAALAEGTSVIQGIAHSEDLLATLDCISALGARYTLTGDAAVIQGRTDRPSGKAVFPCRESGSTLRFFLPLSLDGGGDRCFTGTRRLMERGVGIYETLFREKGICLQKDSERILASGALPPGEYALPGNVSSQFASGLLFALPLLDGDSVIRVLPPVESRAYIDITVAVMRLFGVTVDEIAPNIFSVRGGQTYRSTEATVEGDWSNAAVLHAFHHLGGSITITGLNDSSLQGDRVCLRLFRQLETPGAEIDLSACPDLGPILFALAAEKHGAVFTGTKRLRIKESDRAQSMADELAKFDICADVQENAVIIHPGKLRAPTEVLCGHNDHRIVMALTVLASRVGGTVNGAEAVRKSFPEFFDVLRRLGLEMRIDGA